MKSFIDDEVMKSLFPDIKKCALFIKNALIEGRQPVIRFHNDADGVASAILAAEAVEGFLSKNNLKTSIRSFQTTSAIFTVEDAIFEINRASHMEKKPIIILLDHGANSESLDGIGQLKKNNFKLAIIDHHPPASEIADIADVFVSPFARGGDSNYTTGLLVFEVAKLLFPAVEDRKELVEISLEGDRSKFSAGLESKTTIALGYKIVYVDYPNCLPVYKKFLDNLSEIQEAYDQAQNKLRIALERAETYTKIRQAKNDFTILVVKLKFKEGAYPSKGNILTAVKEKYCAKHPGRPVVALGYGGDKIIIRASKEALEKNFKANDVIKQLKKEFPTEIIAGGGHDVAASMQVKEELAPTITQRFAELVEQII